MDENKSGRAMDLAKRVSRESGTSVDALLKGLEANRQRVAKMTSGSGKYTVLGIDKFDGTDWLCGRYDTAEEALREARRLTREAMPSASSANIATVYYAYDTDGNYLGGDTWCGE